MNQSDSLLIMRQVARIEELGSQVNELTESNRQLREQVKVLELKNRASLVNNLCPDHRDKQVGKPCLACEIEQLREELEGMRNQLSAQTNTITELCFAIDPNCKHGPETTKLVDYAIKTRKLALDIATNPIGNLNYVTNKQREIRQHLNFQHTVNGGIANE